LCESQLDEGLIRTARTTYFNKLHSVYQNGEANHKNVHWISSNQCIGR